jgi:endonuclease YncB( thermonuclease family)
LIRRAIDLLGWAFVATTFLAATTAAAQATLTGRVVGIADGDTITVLDASKAQHHVRIAGLALSGHAVLPLITVE